uniref:Asparagine synthetase [glutamine-hydrolyzing] n=2 Tax=Brassica oleracea TaxID=3712 RepID=ASNS_BRAOL|nr:RecName: Full=Asparagine synthetase [glutamine-hydrolyzing]; AltName: Full=Glutamine-dependent asparagine synthetase [Brassica oleracea]CAA59138.1 asparagine synthase (glutamine-hydrolysing) [Brassica oleracea]
MCGILAVLGCSDDSQAKRVRVLELSRRLRHRGPDWSGIYQNGFNYLAHQRLAIIDPDSGDQPLFNEDKSIVVTVNGEIYNHEELRKGLKNHKFHTGSDCDVIAHLYEEHGENFVDMLDGIFSFVLLDTRDNSFMVARDAVGVTSLYIGWGLDGSLWVSSEMKGLHEDCEHFEAFPPGHLYSSKSGGGFKQWYNPPWFNESVPSTPYEPLAIRSAFEDAVIKRLMTDVPFGVLLSGGLDSSLVASITARHLAGTKAAKRWGPQLHSFCVGLEGSPDLKAGKEVAEYLGTVHHEFHFTVQDGIDAIEDVIYHVETYDVTTIRASTPMFLMSRKIKSLGVKMVLSGEGSDEIFGGYLYFHKAPNKQEFHQETCRKIKALHKYDCLRANKATSAFGLEARVPFLDKEFINTAMSLDPESKMIKPEEGRIEKWVLRRAFDDEERPYLPKHILYRQKEQFSDGVGYSWIDGLKAHAAENVNDKMMSKAAFIFPHNTPLTKEAYYYRMIFERFFPQNSARLTVPGGATVACSTAKAVEWDASWSNNMDPSGRAAIGVHLSAYDGSKVALPLPAPHKAIDDIPMMMGQEVVIQT